MSSEQESWFIRFHRNHNRLKNYIHNAWRFPLPRYGQILMGCFYMSIPLVAGHYIMQWAISKSHENIGERGEKLKNKDVEGVGNQRGDGTIVGAGGWGGGVHLANSDPETQKRNQEKLRKYLKIQKRRFERQERKHRESQEAASGDAEH